jgi:hypothetical protein
MDLLLTREAASRFGWPLQSLPRERGEPWSHLYPEADRVKAGASVRTRWADVNQLLGGQLKIGAPLYPSVQPVTLHPWAALAGTALAATTAIAKNARTNFLMIFLLVGTSRDVTTALWAAALTVSVT